MRKMFILILMVVFIAMAVPAFANNFGDWLKDENSDYSTRGGIYGAWNFGSDSALVPDRLKVSYTFSAGQLDNGTTLAEVGYEWGPGAK